jgi:hypothetical protein
MASTYPPGIFPHISADEHGVKPQPDERCGRYPDQPVFRNFNEKAVKAPKQLKPSFSRRYPVGKISPNIDEKCNLPGVRGSMATALIPEAHAFP